MPQHHLSVLSNDMRGIRSRREKVLFAIETSSFREYDEVLLDEIENLGGQRVGSPVVLATISFVRRGAFGHPLCAGWVALSLRNVREVRT